MSGVGASSWRMSRVFVVVNKFDELQVGSVKEQPWSISKRRKTSIETGWSKSINPIFGWYCFGFIVPVWWLAPCILTICFNCLCKFVEEDRINIPYIWKQRIIANALKMVVLSAHFTMSTTSTLFSADKVYQPRKVNFHTFWRYPIRRCLSASLKCPPCHQTSRCAEMRTTNSNKGVFPKCFRWIQWPKKLKGLLYLNPLSLV